MLYEAHVKCFQKCIYTSKSSYNNHDLIIRCTKIPFMRSHMFGVNASSYNYIILCYLDPPSKVNESISRCLYLCLIIANPLSTVHHHHSMANSVSQLLHINWKYFKLRVWSVISTVKLLSVKGRNFSPFP